MSQSVQFAGHVPPSVKLYQSLPVSTSEGALTEVGVGVTAIQPPVCTAAVPAARPPSRMRLSYDAAAQQILTEGVHCMHTRSIQRPMLCIRRRVGRTSAFECRVGNASATSLPAPRRHPECPLARLPSTARAHRAAHKQTHMAQYLSLRACRFDGSNSKPAPHRTSLCVAPQAQTPRTHTHTLSCEKVRCRVASPLDAQQVRRTPSAALSR